MNDRPRLSAAEAFAAETAAGLPLDSPARTYRDDNHKPEMVLALTRFQAVAGFRAPRRAVEVLAGLDSPLARRMRRTLRLNPTRYGIRQVFSDVVSAATRPSPQEIDALVVGTGTLTADDPALTARTAAGALADDQPLPVVLGRDIVGKPFYADLASMPHVIVAGATGAGLDQDVRQETRAP